MASGGYSCHHPEQADAPLSIEYKLDTGQRLVDGGEWLVLERDEEKVKMEKLN